MERILGCLALFITIGLIIYFARYRNPYDLIWGEIIKTNFCSSTTIQSYVLVQRSAGRGKTEELILVFDTRVSPGGCTHLESEECFHGRAGELCLRLTPGKQLTVKSRDFAGNERKVFQLVMPSITYKD
jgi:hypothetical protein